MAKNVKKSAELLTQLSSLKPKVNNKSNVKTRAEQQMQSLTVILYDKLKDRSNEEVVFSFRLLDREKEAFNLGKVCTAWYITLLEVLRDLSKLKWSQVMTEYKKTYDPHPHTWTKVNYPYEFSEEELNQYDGIQFSLNKSKGRVHGFLLGNRFYVYWLDPYHNMYDSEGYGKVELHPRPKSCFEKLNDRILELQKENYELIKILEEKTSPDL